RAVAIVRIEPIIARLQAHSRRHQDRLVTSAANLKKDAVLVFHLNLFVVEPPRQVHRAEDLQHLFAAELRELTLPLLWSFWMSGGGRRSDRRRRFRLGPGDGFGGDGFRGA